MRLCEVSLVPYEQPERPRSAVKDLFKESRAKASQRLTRPSRRYSWAAQASCLCADNLRLYQN